VLIHFISGREVAQILAIRCVNFLARDSVYAYTRCMLSPVRLSLSVTRMDRQKRIVVKIMKFSPYGNPIPLVLRDMFYPEILMGSPSSGGVKQGSGR